MYRSDVDRNPWASEHVAGDAVGRGVWSGVENSSVAVSNFFFLFFIFHTTHCLPDVARGRKEEEERGQGFTRAPFTARTEGKENGNSACVL